MLWPHQLGLLRLHHMKIRGAARWRINEANNTAMGRVNDPFPEGRRQVVAIYPLKETTGNFSSHCIQYRIAIRRCRDHTYKHIVEQVSRIDYAKRLFLEINDAVFHNFYG